MELPVSTPKTVISLILSVFVFICRARATSCNFFDTVRFDAGDYSLNEATGVIVHQNVTYQRAQWDYYAHENVDGVLVPTSLHKRGCFCDAIADSCIRLCCDFGYLLLPEKGCIRYDQGTFDVNMAVVTHDGEEVSRNLSSFRSRTIVGKPCRDMYDDYAYEDVFKFYENGSILLSYPEKQKQMWFDHHQVCLAIDGYQNVTHLHVSKRICMADVADYLSFKQWLLHHGRYWYFYSVIASVPCLLVSLCIFTLVRELRNMYGKLITIIVVGLTVTDVALLCRIYSTNIQPEVCHILGYVSYFAIMFDYFWGTVLCFDIWLIFSGWRSVAENDRFSYYTLYACGMPVLLTGAVGLLDVLQIPDLDPEVRIFGCFLFVQGYSGLKYIYIPVAVMLVFNMCCFIATAYEICRAHRETVISRAESHQNRPGDSLRIKIFYRLLLNMGLIWSIDVASWLVQKFDRENQVFFIISDIYNFGQGVVIMLFCIFNKRTLKILRKNWRKWRNQRVAPANVMKSSNSQLSTKHTESVIGEEKHVTKF